MTVSVKAPTSTTGSIQLNGSDVLTIESDRSVDIDSNTLHVDATNNRVGIGTSSPSGKLHVNGGDLKIQDTTPNIYLNSEGAVNYVQILANITDSVAGGIAIYENANQLIASRTNYTQFFTANTERMRIDSSGNLLLNTTSLRNSGKLSIDYSGSTNGGIGLNDTASANASAFIGFLTGGTFRGSITNNNNTSVSYNTTSDYRLKENVAPMSGSIDRLKQLKPSTWSWVQDGSHGEGFLAHEAQAVVPEAVTGIKDEVNDEGNPVYQGIDQSKLVPLLTAALQEAITKIEDLETRIQALESA